MASYAQTAFGYMDNKSSYQSNSAKSAISTPKTSTDSIMSYMSDWANMTIQQTAAANAASAAAAMYATQASMADAQRNRDFQQSIYNQTAAYNSSEAAANRAWQENMSNTSYQRAVEDMKKAGINPILAYQQGGASTPSGSVANIGTLSGATGSAYSYQAQVANMNNSLVTMGTIASTAIKAMSSLIDKIDNGRAFDLKSILKRIIGMPSFTKGNGFGSK